MSTATPYSPRAGASALLAPDSYVTDEHRLFRVVSQFVGNSLLVSATLEDCSTLECKAYSPSELQAMHLRAVEPAR